MMEKQEFLQKVPLTDSSFIQFFSGANHLNIRIGEDILSPDRDIQQATVNLFADMNIFPHSLEPHLIHESPSNDHKFPTSKIIEPKDGESFLAERSIQIQVEAKDEEGVVAAVEVSVDGNTWHPAFPKFPEESNHSIWYFLWTPESKETLQTISLQSRATDDSCNTEDLVDSLKIQVKPVHSEL